MSFLCLCVVVVCCLFLFLTKPLSLFMCNIQTHTQTHTVSYCQPLAVAVLRGTAVSDNFLWARREKFPFTFFLLSSFPSFLYSLPGLYSPRGGFLCSCQWCVSVCVCVCSLLSFKFPSRPPLSHSAVLIRQHVLPVLATWCCVRVCVCVWWVRLFFWLLPAPLQEDSSKGSWKEFYRSPQETIFYLGVAQTDKSLAWNNAI